MKGTKDQSAQKALKAPRAHQNKHPRTSIRPMLNILKNSPDGRHTLIIQLIRERKRGVIFTSYRLLPEEFDRKRGRAVSPTKRRAQIAYIQEVNLFLEKQKEEIGRIIAELEREGRPFVVRDITLAYRQRYDNRYVHTFFMRQIDELRRKGSQVTPNNYHATLVAFEKFAGPRRVHFDNVDGNMLLDFEQYLRQIPLQPNTVNFYMSNFRAVYNKAQKRGYVNPDHSPFRVVSTHTEKTRKLAVSAEIIRRVAEAEFPDSEKLTAARDMFMFSFYTRGMSFVDMAYLRQDDIRDGVIYYRRRKTRQLYSVKVIPQVQVILDRYRAQCSPWALPVMLDFGPDGATLEPLVYNGSTPEERRAFEEKIYRRYKYCLSHYLRFYGYIKKRLNLPVKLSFNVARHSWASLARKEGIPVSVISVGLGHTSEKTTQIYLDELDNGTIDDANAKVAGLLEKAGRKSEGRRGRKPMSKKN